MNIPKLRFKGFNDEWHKDKLHNISNNIQYGIGASATNYDGVHKYIRITDINDDNHQLIIDKLTSPSVQTEEDINKFKVNKNDILFARTGASTGKTYLYNPKDGNLFFAGFLIRFHILNNTDSKFIFYQTLLNKYNKWIKLESMRSGQPGINKEQYKKLPIELTCLEEQQKIGALFAKLDNLIDLQAKKLELLKQLKQGLLQKLFPQNNQTTPQLRFKGFNDKWEEKKLGDIIKAKQWKTITNNELINAGYPVYGANGIIGYYSQYNHEKSIVCVTCRGATCGEVHYTKPFSYITGNAMTLEKFNGDYQFLFYALKHRKFLDIITGSAQPQITAQMISLAKIKLPSLPEQQQIGSLFNKLDNLLTKTQEKITLFKQVKKYLLQRMFI